MRNYCRYYILFFGFIGIVLNCSLYHDTFDAEGYIVDSKNKKGIENANVSLSSVDNHVVASTKSNSSGYFKLHINLGFDSSSAGILIIDKEGYNHYSKSISGFSSSIKDTFEIDAIN